MILEGEVEHEFKPEAKVKVPAPREASFLGPDSDLGLRPRPGDENFGMGGRQFRDFGPAAKAIPLRKSTRRAKRAGEISRLWTCRKGDFLKKNDPARAARRA